jgi:hypothetical protein
MTFIGSKPCFEVWKVAGRPGGGWEAEWREDSVAGRALQVEIHDRAIGCVCGVGGWGGYSPRLHGTPGSCWPRLPC